MRVKEIKLDLGVADDAEFVLEEFVEQQNVLTVESWRWVWNPETDRVTAYLTPYFELSFERAQRYAQLLQSEWQHYTIPA